MGKEYISPISIDLGAKHTGVFLAHYVSGSDPAEGARAGHLITAPEGGKQRSQQERTAKRHQRRGYKRAKLAKRLLHVILAEVYKVDLDHVMGPNQMARQWVDGLLNNRGYTYLADEIDKELLSQAGPTIVHLRWPKEFPNRETLFSRLPETTYPKKPAAETVVFRCEHLSLVPKQLIPKNQLLKPSSGFHTVRSHSCYGEDATTKPEERHSIFHIKRDTAGFRE